MMVVRILIMSWRRPGRVVAVDAAGDNLAYIRFRSHLYICFLYIVYLLIIYLCIFVLVYLCIVSAGDNLA